MELSQRVPCRLAALMDKVEVRGGLKIHPLSTLGRRWSMPCPQIGAILGRFFTPLCSVKNDIAEAFGFFKPPLKVAHNVSGQWWCRERMAGRMSYAAAGTVCIENVTLNRLQDVPADHVLHHAQARPRSSSELSANKKAVACGADRMEWRQAYYSRSVAVKASLFRSGLFSFSRV
jgi:hypothetical protein